MSNSSIHFINSQGMSFIRYHVRYAGKKIRTCENRDELMRLRFDEEMKLIKMYEVMKKRLYLKVSKIKYLSLPESIITPKTIR